MMLKQRSVDSDWLFNTQSKVLQADWLIWEINEKAILKVKMPYWYLETVLTRLQYHISTPSLLQNPKTLHYNVSKNPDIITNFISIS